MNDSQFQKIRAEFPLLSQKIRGKNLVYLDSAASALKPWPVIERLSHFYSYETANVHRGAHFLADQATGYYEASREAVRKFLNATTSEEIIFTKGATEAINLVAQTWGKKYLKSGDEILLTEMEHHANIVPWQMIAEEKGAQIKVVKINDLGELDLHDAEKKLSSRTKLFAFTACSNTLGTVNDCQKLVSLAHKVGAKVLVDGAQIVANRPVDLQQIDADFFVFSGHKLFGPYGVGVLFGKNEILESLPPYQGGGSMISEVTFEKTTYNQVPTRFEAGTPNISGVIALAPAIDYITKIGWDSLIEHETKLLKVASERIQEIPGVKIYGQAQQKAPVLSFLLKGAHQADVGQILDQENVAVRVGHHCTQPLMKRLGISGTVRASFSVFNNLADVDALIKGVEKAKGLLI